MTIDDFFNKYNNKGIDFDGYYGFQCMDLYQQFNKEVVGGPHIAANAADVWTKYPKDLYVKVTNAANNFPIKGDVVIWNKNAGGGFGHIAVCYTGDSNKFVSFDQNWPIGSVCHFQSHSYTHVFGWLRPKSTVVTPLPTPQPQQDGDRERGLKVLDDYRLVRKDGKEGNFEGFIRSIIGRDEKFSNLVGDLSIAVNKLQDAVDVVNARDLTIKDLMNHKAGTPSISAIPTKELLAELLNRALGK